MKTKFMLNKEFIEARKVDLEKKQTELKEQLSSIVTKDRQSTEFDADFPDFGDKEDDNAAEVAVYQGNISMEEDIKFSLERIKKALEIIQQGKYGICDRCGEPIAEQRLIVFPQATACMNCKRRKL
ncbi:MAG: hypothetical protein CO073_02055 [Candidatus Komeilibacteria bacterium CG_4_9_14_0_8_um_filter_36_9]|uniref:Zinc finger DksA/TraR C4-type domain-containing protein n=1 Tax=Candidatus Komeilibacteria bacterium CG_4_9_14_0_8_um_filter_36_9 TaxID=1974473 RepID=A0A2M8DRD2_9BACT|nr:MAG: hypothetical protein CO073_02055 [Candidatus Komeilibacteria bacterium CG_4_9_14_0_8_um_filter_36_9]